MKLATLCYVRRRGRTLMMHRVKKKNDLHAGKWNGLGGKFLPGESPEECVVREVREESGLKITAPALKGFLSFPGFDGEDDWYVWVYEARRFTGRLRTSDEGELAWIPDARVSRLPLWEGDRLFLKWMRGRRLFSGKLVYKKGRLKSHRVSFYPASR